MYAVIFFLQSPKERTCKNHFAFYCQLPISSKKNYRLFEQTVNLFKQIVYLFEQKY